MSRMMIIAGFAVLMISVFAPLSEALQAGFFVAGSFWIVGGLIVHAIENKE